MDGTSLELAGRHGTVHPIRAAYGWDVDLLHAVRDQHDTDPSQGPGDLRIQSVPGLDGAGLDYGVRLGLHSRATPGQGDGGPPDPPLELQSVGTSKVGRTRSASYPESGATAVGFSSFCLLRSTPSCFPDAWRSCFSGSPLIGDFLTSRWHRLSMPLRLPTVPSAPQPFCSFGLAGRSSWASR